MLSKIFSYILGSKKAHPYEAIALSGSLVKKEIAKKEVVMFDKAVLGLKVVNEGGFEYFLTVNGDEMVFQIKNDLHLKTFLNKDEESCLMWESGRAFFIFSLSEASEELDGFLGALCALITSTEFGVTIAEAESEASKFDCISNYNFIEDVDAFIESNYAHMNKIDDLTEQLDSMNLSKKPKGSSSFTSAFPQSSEIFSAKGDFYVFDSQQDKYTVSEEDACFSLYQTAPFTYYIVINRSSYDKIIKESNIWYEAEDKVAMWIRRTKAELAALCFIFNEQADYEELREVVVKCKYETSSRRDFSELSEDERQWLIKEQNSNEGFEDTQSNSSEIDFDKGFDQSHDLKSTNRTATQAYLHDRTLVIKGDNSISLYKTNQSNSLVHLMDLPSVKSIDIAEAKMFQSDTCLLLRENDDSSNKLFQYDIGSGKIVSTWSGESKIDTINAFTPENKNDQLTNNSIVLGINDSSLFVFDGRLNKQNKVTNVKTYKSKMHFSCIATNETGHIVIGSSTGEVRLYRNAYQNAKTLFPCFKDAIKGIDITLDGKFILATCDKYLLVIVISETRDRLSCISGGEKKHHYKTLMLNPIDVFKLELNECCFNKARFDNNSNEKESQIISSIGEYLVIWNFTLVKKGILNQYRIKKMTQSVIENQFKYNKPHIVVTTPNSLCIQAHK